jgi:hypothetical protein
MRLSSQSPSVGRGLRGRRRGFDLGSITVPDRSLKCEKMPPVTLAFCKLRLSFRCHGILGNLREAKRTERTAG